MRRLWSYVASVALAIAYSTMAAAQEIEPVAPDPDETDRSVILLPGIRYTIDERFDVAAYGTRVFGDIKGPLAMARLRYMPNNRWGVAVGYFGFWQDGTSARPNPQDQRIRLEGFLNLPLGDDWILSHRSRAEYRFRDLENGWRYRPNVRLQRVFDLLGDRSMSAFVYAEPFYDFNASAITSIEYAVGINLDVVDGLNLEAWAAHSGARGPASDFQYIGLLLTYDLN